MTNGILEKLGIRPKRFTTKETTKEQKLLESCNAIEKIVPELKIKIKEKDAITMSTKDLMEKIGPAFEPRDIYWKARYCLFNNDIIITSTKKDHEPAVLMRSRTPDDKLPHSLNRYIELLKKREIGKIP